MSARMPVRWAVSSFLRSFFIQGSWNYHTMIGSGFAFAILPGLRSFFGSSREGLEEPLRRHVEHFNAHPYLSSVALGATLRMESEGADPEQVRRFKVAVRGPLGSLGDALVWASWLPTVSVISLLLYWWGLPGWAAVVIFLLLYNAGHVGLRIWGFRTGLREGHHVGRHLGHASLGRWTARLRSVGTLCLGLLVGAVLAGEGGLGETGMVWTGLGMVAFVVGLVVGHLAWRPTAAAVVAAVSLVATWGLLR